MNGSLSLLRSAFLSVERRITQAAVFLGCLGLVLAALAGMYQVIARFILFQPASWSEPFVQLTLIWMTYLALAGAMRTGTLISVDLLRTLSRGRGRLALDAFTTLAVFALLAVIVWFGSTLVWRVRFQSIAGLNISASWAYAALPTGALISILALFAHALNPPAAADIDIASDSAG